MWTEQAGKVAAGAIALLGLTVVVMVGGCRPAERRRQTAPLSPVVATVAGVPLRAADVRTQMRARGTDAARALDDLVTFELLARAAADASDRGPAAAELEALTAAKVSRLIEREIEPRIAASAIPESEVRALYERGKGRFVHGRLVQVAVLCVFTGARMKAEPRARAAETARRLKEVIDSAAHTGTTAMTAAAFEAISQNPVWMDRGVSFTTVWQSEDTPFPPVVGRAVQALTKAGDLTALVADETGNYIALYLGERPPENISLAEAAPALKKDMYEPWRRRRFLQLSLEMAQGHTIEVYPENLLLLAGAPPAP